MTRRSLLYGLPIGLFLFTGAAAAGTITVYTDRASWEAAISGEQTIDFGTLNPPTGNPTLDALTYTTPSGLTIGGVNFSDTATSDIHVVSDTFCCAAYARGGAALLTNTDGTGILATLPSSTSAAGMNLYSVQETDLAGAMSETVDVVVNDGANHTYTVSTPPSPDNAFFGIVDTALISGVTITPEQAGEPTNASILSFSIGQGLAGPTTAAPEPCYGGALAAIGILALAGRHLKLRRTRSRPISPRC